MKLDQFNEDCDEIKIKDHISIAEAEIGAEIGKKDKSESRTECQKTISKQ